MFSVSPSWIKRVQSLWFFDYRTQPETYPKMDDFNAADVRQIAVLGFAGGILQFHEHALAARNSYLLTLLVPSSNIYKVPSQEIMI